MQISECNTSLGSLLVHDSVTALTAPNSIFCFDFIFRTTVLTMRTTIYIRRWYTTTNVKHFRIHCASSRIIHFLDPWSRVTDSMESQIELRIKLIDGDDLVLLVSLQVCNLQDFVFKVIKQDTILNFKNKIREKSVSNF